ncbi:hypothetical protein OIE66_05910 [Nonomuraea sp. NBC_01738]|uniref:hypothetical protein n=1 Tax=Nonomuraea sp. NBC_01738 TaxID=2976003 RepID=UPI002E0F197D|nr:hypothetical protein OIE66_05910 [Nonomuraea sp. NBC_01738]
MSDTLAAFHRVAALADEHRADLDDAIRLSAAHAWVGGGATRFAAAIATHRASVRSALTLALNALTRTTSHQQPYPDDPGPPTPPAAPPAGDRPLSGDHRHGVDAQAIAELADALDTAAGRLAEAAAAIRGELTAFDLPASPGWTISRAAQWAASQTPDLRRRLRRLRSEHTTTLPAHVAAYDLYGVYSTPGDPDTLLNRLAKGDAEALADLLDLHDPSLPARVHAWWSALPAPLTDLPGIGALNGLPCAARDRANRAHLSAERERLTRELARLRSPGSVALQDPVLLSLRRIAALERALRTADQAHLLAFNDPLAIAWADPDTADVTAVHLTTAPPRLSDLRDLWRRTRAATLPRTLSLITWFTDDTSSSGALAAFVDALRATRAAPGRLTVIAPGECAAIAHQADLLRGGRFADRVITAPEFDPADI